MATANLTINNVCYAQKIHGTWDNKTHRIVAGYVNGDNGNQWYVGCIQVTVPKTLDTKVATKIEVTTPLSGDSRVRGTRAVLSTTQLKPTQVDGFTDIANASPTYDNNGTLTTYPDGWSSDISNKAPHFVFTLPNRPLNDGNVYYIYFYSTNTNKGATRTAFHGATDTHGNYSKYSVEVTYLDTYTISYNANGGSGAPSTQTKTQGKTLTLSPNIPTRGGYTCLGWSTDAKATTATYQPGGTFTTDVSTTLYAVWRRNTYTIKYQANGGTGAMSDTVVSYGIDTQLPTNDFIYKGHTFLGWYAYRGSDKLWAYHNATEHKIYWSAEGKQTTGDSKYIYEPLDTVSTTSPVDNDVVYMYAVWRKNRLSIVYDANGGEFTKGQTTISGTYGTKYGSDGSVADIDNTFDARFTGHHVDSGYEWNTKSDGTGISIDDSQIYETTEDLATAIGASIDNSDCTVTLYANWNIDVYTIRYNSNGGSTVPNTTVNYGTLTKLSSVIPTKTGYTFTGWLSDVYAISNNNITINVDLDHGSYVDVVATWRPNKGTIYFHANGGIVNTTKYNHTVTNDISSLTQQVTYEDSSIQVFLVGDLFTRTYHYVAYDATAWISRVPEYTTNGDLLFPQWCAINGESHPLQNNDYQDFVNQIKVTDFRNFLQDGDCEIHLYANWVSTYLKVNYVLSTPNNGVQGSASEYYKYNELFSLSTPQTLWSTKIERFDVGHHISDNPWKLYGTDTHIEIPTNMNAADFVDYLQRSDIVNYNLISEPQSIMLEPYWEQNTYHISYNSVGGSEVASTAVTHGTPTTISDVIPVKSGYTFSHWELRSWGQIISYTAGSEITIEYDVPHNSEIMLYAVWASSGSAEVVDSRCFIKYNGIWYKGTVFSKDGTWKNATIFRKTDNVYC